MTPSPAPRVCEAGGCSVSLADRHPNCRFCSRRCKRGFRRPPSVCDWCGEPMNSTHGNAKFCSTTCRSKKANSIADREAARRRVKEWRLANPERYRTAHAQRTAARRARLQGAYVEDVDRQEVWRRDQGVCHICGLPADPARWHLDHVVPLASGGSHAYDNVAVSHPACNLRKGARPL